MYAQEKTERLLRLMQMMSGPVEYTIGELSSRLDMSERTIYRYIETFRDVGFTVIRKERNVPRLITTNRRGLDFDSLVCFSAEEAAIVNGLIDSLDQGNALKAGLKAKLAAVCEQTPMARIIANRDTAEKLNLLSDAIRTKKKVFLRGYESGNTLTISDRLVEPFSFSVNNTGINAFEPASGICKTFTISRIGSVEVLDDPWENEPLHREKPTDIFRMSADAYLEHVKIRLTLLAKNLLLEEYPLSAEYITQVEPPAHDSKEMWLLETNICSVFGAGRFVLGLAADAEVLEGPILKEYLARMIEEILIPDFLDRR